MSGAELLRLEREATEQTSISDIVEAIGAVEDMLWRLEDELDELKREFQRLRDDVNYLLSKI